MIPAIKYATLWVIFSVAFCRLFTSFIEVNLLKFHMASHLLTLLYLLKSINLYKCVSLSESLLSNSRCISNKMNLILVEYLFLKKQGAVTDEYLLHYRNYFLSEIDNQFGIDQVDTELNYNLACIEANLGNYNQCMRYLFLAENKIYDVNHPLYLFKERLKYDEDLIPLRKQPMFIKYLNK